MKKIWIRTLFPILLFLLIISPRIWSFQLINEHGIKVKVRDTYPQEQDSGW